jgi:O-antigen/teichoic acid export membrane protein
MPNPADPDLESQSGRIGKRGSYRSGFLFGTLSFLGVSGLGLVSTVVTARLYGVRIIGEFALVTVPVAVLWALSSVKEQQALIKEITPLPPRHPRVTQLFAVVFSFSAALTIVVALVDMVVCWFAFRGPLDAPYLLGPAFLGIAGRAVIANTGWNIDSILSAFVAGRQIFWVRLHEVLSFILIALAIGLVWRSVWGLVIATVASYSTSLVHRMIVVRPFVRGRLTRAEYRSGMQVLPELLRFGLKATPGQIAQGISQQIGIWTLGTVASVTVVGAYSRAQTIPQRLQGASNRITEVLYPTLVGRHTTGDGHGFDRALLDSIRYEAVGMLLIAAVIGGAAHSVLEIFGAGFSRATAALAIVMIFPALASVTATQTQALWATNRPGQTSWIALVRLVATIGLLVLLTSRFGILGPAIALVAGYVIVAILNSIALQPHLTRPVRATWPLREQFALVVTYAGGFLAANLVEHQVPGLAGLPLVLAVGCIAYAALFVGLGGINQRDRARLAEGVEMARAWRARRADARGPQGEERLPVNSNGDGPTTASVESDVPPGGLPVAPRHG